MKKLLLILKGRVVKAIEWSLIVLYSFMLFSVCWQVMARFIFKAPSSYSDELSRFLLIWVSLLGASYATGRKAHLSIDILAGKLKGSPKKYLHRVIYLMVILFALLILVVGGLNLVLVTFALQQQSAAMGIPMGWVYSIIPLSGIFIILFASIDFLDAPNQSDSL